MTLRLDETLCFIFEAQEETKIEVITMRRKLVNISGTFTAEKTSFVCCWDVHVLLHQALLIFIFFLKKEKWVPLNNTQTTGARHKFHFGCCMLFCICTEQAGVTRSVPELLDVSLSCNESLLKLQGVLASCQCAEAHCKPTQVLPCTEIERSGRSAPSKSSNTEDPLLQTQCRNPVKMGSCRHTHGWCLTNLWSPNSCFFAPKGSPCVRTYTAPKAAGSVP